MNRNFGGGAVDEGGQGANMELHSNLEYYNQYHPQKADAGLAVTEWSAQGPQGGGNAAGLAAHTARGGIQRPRGGMGGGMRKPEDGGGSAGGRRRVERGGASGADARRPVSGRLGR